MALSGGLTKYIIIESHLTFSTRKYIDLHLHHSSIFSGQAIQNLVEIISPLGFLHASHNRHLLQLAQHTIPNGIVDDQKKSSPQSTEAKQGFSYADDGGGSPALHQLEQKKSMATYHGTSTRIAKTPLLNRNAKRKPSA